MRVPINLDNVKSGREPITPGTYLVTIEKYSFEKSKKGDDMVNVTFSVLDEKFKGRLLWRYYVLTEKALPFFKELCSAASVKWTKDGVELDELIGKKVRIDVSITDYNGSSKNEVGNVKKP